MRGLPTAVTIISLLVTTAGALAQSAGTLEPNPFRPQGPAPVAPVDPASPPAAQRPAQRRTAATTGANQFDSESAAKQACGSDPVVWANTSGSRAWHVSGDRYFGHTKHGAYMCEQAARQAGYHAAGDSPRRGQRTH
jgi:hypothetical protein